MSEVKLRKARDPYGVVHLTWIHPRESPPVKTSLCSTLSNYTKVKTCNDVPVTCLFCLDIETGFA